MGSFSIWHWFIVIVIVGGPLLAVWVTSRRERRAVAQSQAGKIEGPKGIGGWLILPALNITIIPIAIAAGLAAGVAQLDGPGDLLDLPALNKSLGIAILLLLFFGIFSAYAFWTKKASAPRLFCTFLFIIPMISLAMIFIDDDTSGEDVRGLAATLIYAAIWTSYMRRSRRVRNTFVN